MRKVKVYRGGIIKLPAEVRRALGVEEGDELVVYVEAGKAILVPPRRVDPVIEFSSVLGRPVDEDKVLEEASKELSERLSELGRLEPVDDA